MSPIEMSAEAREFLDRHTHGHLATACKRGIPHVVPVCYARIGPLLYFVCDEKPKRKGARALKRLANLRENPHVALVVDDYEPDWSKLAYLLLHLDAAVVCDSGEYERGLAALRERYIPYASMTLQPESNPMVRMTPTSAHLWMAKTPQALPATQ